MARKDSGSRSLRGFAAMDEAKQKEIARKGGEAVSRDREHMAEIGAKGGRASHRGRNTSSGRTTR